MVDTLDTAVAVRVVCACGDSTHSHASKDGGRESCEVEWRPLSEGMLTGRTETINKNVGGALRCVVGCSDGAQVGSAAEAVSEEYCAGIAAWSGRKGSEVVHADSDAGNGGQRLGDDGSTDRVS